MARRGNARVRLPAGRASLGDEVLDHVHGAATPDVDLRSSGRSCLSGGRRGLGRVLVLVRPDLGDRREEQVATLRGTCPCNSTRLMATPTSRRGGGSNQIRMVCSR